MTSNFRYIGSPEAKRSRQPSTVAQESGAAALNVLASPIFYANRHAYYGARRSDSACRRSINCPKRRRKAVLPPTDRAS